MKKFSESGGIVTEIGSELFPFTLAYHTYGTLKPDGTNVKWVFHALTANSDAASWWAGLFGSGKILDPSEDYIVCVNMPTSCYGSTGPLTLKPNSQEKYYHDFPVLTIRDIVNSFRELKKHLSIEKINMGIGGSMGGSVLLEWNVSYPQDFENSIFVAASASESSWGKAIHTVHKMAIETDSSWNTNSDEAGIQGLQTARGVGMLFYRTHKSFNDTQIDHIDQLNNYKSDSYIRYQGSKLSSRFNAFSYYFLLNTLDTHNVGRKRGGIAKALSKVESRCLIIGINSDILYPKEEQVQLHDNINLSELHFIDSAYGHDGFLIETEKINAIATAFLKRD